MIYPKRAIELTETNYGGPYTKKEYRFPTYKILSKGTKEIYSQENTMWKWGKYSITEEYFGAFPISELLYITFDGGGVVNEYRIDIQKQNIHRIKMQVRIISTEFIWGNQQTDKNIMTNARRKTNGRPRSLTNKQ